jgi:glycosyltransferase involved in cell wall biosynthesis
VPYLISIIIPCCNSERFLERTLNSVLKQDYPPLEVIAVDDGSTDGTRDILKRYPAVRVLSHPRGGNRGVAASMNLGVTEAQGELIAFMDHDDLWAPQKLRKQNALLEQYPDIGFVYTKVKVIDENDVELFAVEQDEEGFVGPEELLLRCSIRTSSSVLLRKELFAETGPFRTDIFSADHDMWLKMAEITRFALLPEYLTFHRKHTTQLTASRKIWEDGFIILNEAVKRYPYSFSCVRKRRAVLHFRLAQYDWHHAARGRAALHAARAALNDPLRAARVSADSVYRKMRG